MARIYQKFTYMTATHKSTISSIFESLDLIQEESEGRLKEGIEQAQSVEEQAKQTSLSEAAQLLQEKQKCVGSGKSTIKINTNKPHTSNSVAFSMVSASTVAAPKYWGGRGSKRGKNKKEE